MIRVLIADDHAIFRQGLSELLSGREQVLLAGSARDGSEALSMTRELRPDVLILDISMPVMDGFEVTRRIRAEGLPVKVLILSMHKEASSVRRALESGADGYMLKEEAFDDLEQAIASIVGGSRFLSAPVRAALSGSGNGEMQETLTPREREVVSLIAAGKTTREIAVQLGIGVKTVETHRQHVMDKLGFHKTAQIAIYAIKEGLAE
ncbi:MAG TPA: response regulator transcription factor [Candidatus Deferrimicrobiaceae bacterium]|jgi:DNA-binding NarL/FixJ family response regulator